VNTVVTLVLQNLLTTPSCMQR